MLEMLKRKREEVRKNNKGFTLMELLVVVAILGFLVAMLAPRYMNYTDRAMGTAAAADVRNIMTIATGRMMDTNAMPTLADLEASMNTKFGAGSDKTLTVANTGAAVYTYSKSGVLITVTMDLSVGTASFDVTAVGGGDATPLVKLERVARGIGSGNTVKVKGTDFYNFNETAVAP